MSKVNIAEHLEVCPDWGPSDPRGTFLSTALAGEAGELANLYKKEWRDGHSVERRIRIVKELGDVGCYALMLAHHLGVDFMELIEASFFEFEGRPEYKKLLSKMRLIRQCNGAPQ